MFFQVDNEKCIRDGVCVLECPARIIEMKDDVPVLADGGEEVCIRCGHCVAVCSEAALKIENLTPEDCAEIDTSTLPSAEQAEQFLKTRRSIRTYRKKGLSKDLLEKALAIASCAPSGSNKQPVKWLVLHDREQVEAVAGHVADWMTYLQENKPEVAEMLNTKRILEGRRNGIDRICRDAPHLVMTYASKEFSIAPADCHTALAYLELVLPPLGAGSCWAGYVSVAATQWPPLIKYLNLPADHIVHGAAMVGYPKFRFHRIPPRNKPDITYR